MDDNNRQFKIMDIITCIDSTGLADHITEGCKYIFLTYKQPYKDKNRIVIQKDDTGKYCTCFEDRFILSE